MNTDLGLLGHFLLIYTNCTFLLLYCQVNKFRKSTVTMAWVKRQDFIGCPIRRFNVVIGPLSLNNSFSICVLKKETVILFGYSSTLHHPVATTIKCQFLRGQLLIISCILRVQYLCLRFMHLYFTP